MNKTYRNALWESEKPLASVSFTIVQSKANPAKVLKVFPINWTKKNKKNFLKTSKSSCNSETMNNQK